MDPASLSSTSPPFRLLDLPLELQRIIFSHALYTETILRRPTDIKRKGDARIYSGNNLNRVSNYGDGLTHLGTNLLRVSSRIKEETLPIFYQVNHFHCEQFRGLAKTVQFDDLPPLPPLFLRSIHMIRHISIHALYNSRHREVQRKYLEEGVLVNALVHIERHAPNLRKLAIHFAPAPHSGLWCFGLSLTKPIARGSTCISVATVLCRLRARLERLSLVYYGRRRDLEKVCSNIAPLEDWTGRMLDAWPVTLDPSQFMGLEHSRWFEPKTPIGLWEHSRCRELHAGDRDVNA